MWDKPAFTRAEFRIIADCTEPALKDIVRRGLLPGQRAGEAHDEDGLSRVMFDSSKAMQRTDRIGPTDGEPTRRRYTLRTTFALALMLHLSNRYGLSLEIASDWAWGFIAAVADRPNITGERLSKEQIYAGFVHGFGSHDGVRFDDPVGFAGTLPEFASELSEPTLGFTFPRIVTDKAVTSAFMLNVSDIWRAMRTRAPSAGVQLGEGEHP